MELDYPVDLMQLEYQIADILKSPIINKSVEIKFMPSVRIDWCWSSDSCGDLIVDFMSPKSINVSDLIYIGQLCMSSVLRYRTIVMISQKDNAMRFARTGLSGDISSIMDELEKMLNLWEAFEVMLSGGTFGRRRA